MELLVALGIGYLGHRFSSKGKDTRDVQQPQRHSGGSTRSVQRAMATVPAQPGGGIDAMLAQDRARMDARWEEARDPVRTGVITPNTNPSLVASGAVPFFRSGKSQNTSTSVKQTRMELFTGSTDAAQSVTGTYQHKKEADALFQPGESRGLVTSGGTAGNQPVDLERALETERSNLNSSGARFNNTAPVQQLRVGKGVNVGADVAATGGFHSRYRVLPTSDELGSYKRTQLPGDVTLGKSRVDRRESDRRMVLNRGGPVEWTQERRPMQETGQAALRGQSFIPVSSSDPRRVAPVEQYAGNQMRSGMALGSSALDATRIQDRSARFPALNATSAASGAAMGHFAVAEYDASRIERQQREASEPYVANRSTPGAKARTTAPGELLPPTQRDLSRSDVAIVGPGGSRIQSRTQQWSDRPHTTLKELTTGMPGKVLGGSALVDRTQYDNAKRYNVLDRTAKRGDQLVASRVGMSRVNVVDPRAGGKETVSRSQTLRDGLQGHARLPHVYQQEAGSLSSTFNKLPVQNPRLDLEVAKTQLANNPYNHTFAA